MTQYLDRIFSEKMPTDVKQGILGGLFLEKFKREKKDPFLRKK